MVRPSLRLHAIRGSRRLARWTLTAVLAGALLASGSAAYELIIGEYTLHPNRAPHLSDRSSDVDVAVLRHDHS